MFLEISRERAGTRKEEYFLKLYLNPLCNSMLCAVYLTFVIINYAQVPYLYDDVSCCTIFYKNVLGITNIKMNLKI